MQSSLIYLLIRRNSIKRKYIIPLLLVLFFINPVSAGTVSGYFHPSGYYYGETGWHEWQDYCPLCGHYDCLMIGMKGIHDEISCKHCGADYDGTNGMDKWDGGARAKLIPHVRKEVQVEAKQIDKKEVFIREYKNYKGLLAF